MLESWLTWAVIAFLGGSIPFGLLLGFCHGVDIRRHGSGNVGATNCGRVLGPAWGVLCLALDVLKGLLPVLACGLVWGYHADQPDAIENLRWLAVGAAAVLGHVFPPWLGFRGGKGVATSLGVLLGYWPILTFPGLTAVLTWLLVAWLFRYVSLASMAAAVSLPLYLLGAALLTGQLAHHWPFLVVTALLAALVLFRHRANFSRLRHGTEPKIGQRTS